MQAATSHHIRWLCWS